MSQKMLTCVSLVLLIRLTNSAAVGQPIDTCGELALSEDCVLFRPDTGGVFALSSPGGFASGTRIHVVGTLDTTCLPPCPLAQGCIVATTVEACGPEFFGCGTLVTSGPCLLFQSDSSGTFVLDTTGEFNIGARVQVSGTADPNCGSACLPTSGCIAVSSITGCGQQFSSCGLLVQRGACVVLVADQGGTFVLDTLGGFVVGDRVLVTGTLDLACESNCVAVNGCITGNTIQACASSFTGCGTLIQGSGCILFRADAGETFGLANRGGFAVGQRVSVTGRISTDCAGTCMQVPTCIVGNTIEVCEATPPPAPSGCATTSAALISLSLIGLWRSRRGAL